MSAASKFATIRMLFAGERISRIDVYVGAIYQNNAVVKLGA
jgi:hypothetical protein